jgi:hypothetical protein
MADRFIMICTKSWCNLTRWFGHRKSQDYRWSNSGSGNPGENTIWKRPTYWLYHNILKYFDIDPYKGLNSDQYRSYALWVYERKDTWAALRVLLPFIVRLGLTPSLCEWLPLKIHSYVLFFRVLPFYYLNPLYWISRIIFHFSMKRNLKEDIAVSTTNKITLLPTMYYLGYKLPEDEYIEAVYDTYYGKDSEIAKELKKVLTNLN